MKSIYLLMASLLLCTSTSFAQFKNQKTETYKIAGNCNSCKEKIEKIGSKKNESKVVWDVDTEIATISYDSSKTNGEEILKRIAIEGYDNEKFIAPDNAYNKLDACCQYDRKSKSSNQDHSKMDHSKMTMNSDSSKMDHKQCAAGEVHSKMDHKQCAAGEDHSKMDHKQCAAGEDHSKMDHKQCAAGEDHSKMDHGKMAMNADHATMNHNQVDSSNHEQSKSNELAQIFQNYDKLKNAFIAADDKKIIANSTELLKSIKSVQMNKLSNDEHLVWMKIQQNLMANSEKITKSKNITKQREAFSALSEDIYSLIKASKPQSTVYYMHCPMFNNGKGANWLSSENQVKNPYYGSQMLSCGSIIETIK